MIRPQFRLKKKDNPEHKTEEGEQPENVEKKEEQIRPEKTAEQKKKIRCNKWPACKNEACEYAHPTETVNPI